MANERILIVDHNAQQRQYLVGLLNSKDYRTIEAATCEEAIDILQNAPVDLILTETELPSKSGLFLLKESKEMYPDLEVILITSNASSFNVLQALRHDAYDFIVRPIDSGDILFNILDRAIDTINLRRHNNKLVKELEEKNRYLVRHLKMMEALNESIVKVNAANDIEELLLGLLTSAMNALGSKRGYIALNDKSGENLSIKAGKGIPADLLKECAVRMPPGFTSEAIRRGKPVVVNSTFPKKLLTMAADVERNGLVAGPGLLAAPLEFKDRIVGIIILSQQKKGLAYGDTELNFLIQLAHHAALALEKAGIIYQLKRNSAK